VHLLCASYFNIGEWSPCEQVGFFETSELLGARLRDEYRNSDQKTTYGLGQSAITGIGNLVPQAATFFHRCGAKQIDFKDRERCGDATARMVYPHSPTVRDAQSSFTLQCHCPKFAPEQYSYEPTLELLLIIQISHAARARQV
jgi:hypothetical protein